jgi:hypothetical protein
MTTAKGRRVLCVNYGDTIEQVIDGLSRRDGILRDILLYGQDMRSHQGGAGQPYDGPGGSGGAALAIPEGMAMSVPYAPFDSRVSHKILKDPTVDDIVENINDFKPTCVLVHSGVIGKRGSDFGMEVLAPLPTEIINQKQLIIAAMKRVKVKIVYIDSKKCTEFAHDVRKATDACVIAWMSSDPTLVFNAYNFLFAFFGSLEMKNITPECAFAIASELTSAFCLGRGGNAGPEIPPSLPHLLSDGMPSLPGLGFVEEYMDDDKKVVDVYSQVPGFKDVRLCAPNAEIRLLVAALPSAMMVSARLGSLCQGIRGIIAAEILSASLVNKAMVAIPPPYLPEGSQAYRCTMKSANGIAFDVVAGGPSSIMKDGKLVEYALRQSLVADAHSIQMKLPPPGAPMPPYHSVALVASGAPVIEIMVSASTWVLYLLKRLCEIPFSKSLVIAGIGATSTSINSAFSKRDSLRQTSTIANGNLSRIRPSTGLITADMLVGASPELENAVAALEKCIPTPSAVPTMAQHGSASAPGTSMAPME